MYTNDGTCFRSIKCLFVIIVDICDKFTVIVRFLIVMVIIVNVSIDVLNVGIKYQMISTY